MNETTVTVVGNIASQVTAKRVGAEGHFLANFRIASSERRWDKATGSWVDGDRFSAWVSCWRRLGEHVSASLVKGDPVVVHGKVSVREYEVNGERRYSTELAASSVGPDLNRCTSQVSRIRPAGDGDRTDQSATVVDDAPAVAGPDDADPEAPAERGDDERSNVSAGEPDDQPDELAAVA